RLDLAQAEAVLDVVRARTEASLRVAMQGLGGRLSAPVKELRSELMQVLAYLTARIDFPEDEIEEREVLPPLREAQRRLRELIASAAEGMVYRQGVKTAIVGRPNVGKSSLLNRLLREDRAIVTPVPGTTRDTLEEVVNLKGVPFLLIDTAGLGHSRDEVESLGMERSRRVLAQADLVLWVVDASQPIGPLDREIMALLKEKAALIVANKSDLPRQLALDNLSSPSVCTCALTGEGIAELEARMVDLVLQGGGRLGRPGNGVHSSDAPLVSNPRHKAALERGEKHLAQALASLEAGMPDDFATIDVTAALNALGEITGETVGDDLLEAIFSQFCVGK
ncbi:MAG: tRNA modification GTPase, partial [Chloroflexota bacterium]|nr:tRNA modification GTPase [Chloroflexota bacterium]